MNFNFNDNDNNNDIHDADWEWNQEAFQAGQARANPLDASQQADALKKAADIARLKEYFAKPPKVPQPN